MISLLITTQILNLAKKNEDLLALNSTQNKVEKGLKKGQLLPLNNFLTMTNTLKTENP